MPSNPESPASAHALGLPVTQVRGVGPERAALLGRLGIVTVADLLWHRPRRMEDRRALLPISRLALGEPATVCGTIMASGVKWLRQRTRSVFEFVLDDGTGRLHCRWWNLPMLERVFRPGDVVLVFGKPNSLRPRQMDRPETERFEGEDDPTVHLRRIVPVHGATEGLTPRTMRTLVWNALEQFGPALEPDGWDGSEPGAHPDGQPWPERRKALRDLHFPGEMADAERARERFAAEEFLRLQREIRRRRESLARAFAAPRCPGDNRLMRPFLARLGFALTDAQSRVLRDIRKDVGGVVPMRRLLQGDVGSGKTVVAACAAVMALEAGHDVVVMAPTEILARQLGAAFQRWLGPFGVGVGLHAGGRCDASGGDGPRVTVGTHALLEADVDLGKPGLLVIDEQHKFGVSQRESLLRKAGHTHLLVMTATPIPRTLGLTVYGDLDISVLDAMPAGRQPVRTHVRDASALPKVWEFVRGELAAGRQAYVVCPRVEESGDDDVRAVLKEFDAVKAAMEPSACALVHGRMASAERDAAMEAFRSGAAPLLVATQVIEVGVDVPAASVIVVMSAERFGLAQLHQLRGRVGRGLAASHCILVADAKTDAAQARLDVMARTRDGFEIAEEDFRLRGPGELLGHAQSGMPSFRFGDLGRDLALMRWARDQARSGG
ncbi:MAG: ATP-dependent DNA helicase RecG [Verrucomicrobiota bacterium]|jgi:ATP-dependent DNA helicase RecG